MKQLEQISLDQVRDDYRNFREKTKEFYDGKLSVKDYKGFSGKFGSYAQRGKKGQMLRLRMGAGRMPKEKMNFVNKVVKEHDINLIHFTTCQALQLHNLTGEQAADIMDEALNVNIITYGGGGDFPRNVMCSPLAGVDPDEYFDVLPYAEATANYLMHFINGPKMPRKLKVAFSGSPANRPHATFRDLGFVATPEGKFDVYAAGGLGANPKLGVKVYEGADPKDILYFVQAMMRTFRKYGNYENRAKARTRYMVEALGSEEAFKEAFLKELEDVYKEQDLVLEDLVIPEVTKIADGSVPQDNWNITAQKQPGLYTVNYHPKGGSPNLDVFNKLAEYLSTLDQVEIRLSPDESAMIINLSGKEADEVEKIIAEDTAKSPLETSVSCIGASICQVGIRDSQSLLAKILEKAEAEGIKADALPKIYISGCPSSCGTHQAGIIGFRGGVKVVDKKPVPAFFLYVHGNEQEGHEALGKEVGAIAEEAIPDFMMALGRTVEASGLPFEEWIKANPSGIEEAAASFLL